MSRDRQEPGVRARLYGRVPTLLIARRNIARAKVRSALAVGAIVIGVVAIGAVGAGGVAFSQSVLGQLDGIGAQDVIVLPGEDADDFELDQGEIARIDRATGTAEFIAVGYPNPGGAELVSNRGEFRTVDRRVIDTPGRVLTATAGTIPTEFTRGVLVGRDAAEELDIQPGDRIKLRTERRAENGELVKEERTYTVRAVVEPAGTGQLVGGDSVIIPPDRLGDPTYRAILFRADTTADAQRVAATLRDRFNRRDQQLQVIEFSVLIDQVQSVLGQVQQLLVGLGAVSLVVAGVSIANTMLMSVTRRRAEIGVLRAVGYQRGAILRILLAEALLLGLTGAVIGTPIAVALGAAANLALLGDPLAFTTQSAVYFAAGVGFGVLASLVGGLYPAWRAATDRPVDALRG